MLRQTADEESREKLDEYLDGEPVVSDPTERARQFAALGGEVTLDG